MMRRGAGLVLLAIALASRALAQTVTDGDTLK
jgi:hypothetical protein